MSECLTENFDKSLCAVIPLLGPDKEGSLTARKVDNRIPLTSYTEKQISLCSNVEREREKKRTQLIEVFLKRKPQCLRYKGRASF